MSMPVNAPPPTQKPRDVQVSRPPGQSTTQPRLVSDADDYGFEAMNTYLCYLWGRLSADLGTTLPARPQHWTEPQFLGAPRNTEASSRNKPPLKWGGQWLEERQSAWHKLMDLYREWSAKQALPASLPKVVEGTKVFLQTVATSARSNPREFLRLLRDLSRVDKAFFLMRWAVVPTLDLELRMQLAAFELTTLQANSTYRHELWWKTREEAQRFLPCMETYVTSRWDIESEFQPESVDPTGSDLHPLPSWSETHWNITYLRDKDWSALIDTRPSWLQELSVPWYVVQDFSDKVLDRLAKCSHLHTINLLNGRRSARQPLLWLNRLPGLKMLNLGPDIALSIIPIDTLRRLTQLSFHAPTFYDLNSLPQQACLEDCPATLRLIVKGSGTAAWPNKLTQLSQEQLSGKDAGNLPLSINALEIGGNDEQLEAVLTRLPDLFELRLGDGVQTLAALNPCLSSASCKLRTLQVQRSPRPGHIDAFLDALTRNSSLHALQLNRNFAIHTKERALTMVQIITGHPTLENLTLRLSMAQDVAGPVLDAIPLNARLREISLQFEWPKRDEHVKPLQDLLRHLRWRLGPMASLQVSIATPL